MCFKCNTCKSALICAFTVHSNHAVKSMLNPLCHCVPHNSSLIVLNLIWSREKKAEASNHRVHSSKPRNKIQTLHIPTFSSDVKNMSLDNDVLFRSEVMGKPFWTIMAHLWLAPSSSLLKRCQNVKIQTNFGFHLPEMLFRTIFLTWALKFEAFGPVKIQDFHIFGLCCLIFW